MLVSSAKNRESIGRTRMEGPKCNIGYTQATFNVTKEQAKEEGSLLDNWPEKSDLT